MAKATETPMMRQFGEIKAKYPDAIILFRCGDFYETYGSDAVVAADILGITLTKRSNKNADALEMAGFPYHALESYLPRLVRAGKRVAICDQLEDPKTVKAGTLVKRGMTELVTPGVSTDDNILNKKENNFLAAIHFNSNIVGVAFLDISTGDFMLSEGSVEHVEKLINNFSPKEVLYEQDKRKVYDSLFGQRYFTFEQDDWIYSYEAADERLRQQFQTTTLKGFGIEQMTAGIVAAGAILYYLDQTKHQQLSHITTLSRIDTEQYMWLDQFTIRNLELFHTPYEGGTPLINIIDNTATPMGSRLLRRWVSFPLKEVDAIVERQEVVDALVHNKPMRDRLYELLKPVGDLERISSRIAVKRVTPRELLQLKVALATIQPLKDIGAQSGCTFLQNYTNSLHNCEALHDRILREIADDAPNQVNKGGIIALGYSKELDELREIAYNGKDYLLRLQQREIEATEIPSLKIGYNNVFGYYLEVRNTHKDKVPADWIRKQTLVNAERYITQELKEYEEKILGAEERIGKIETQLFNELVDEIMNYMNELKHNCLQLAIIDCLVGFAIVSEKNDYHRPEVADDDQLNIVDGRHPVIEQQLPIGEKYIPNDVHLDSDKQQIIIITGPNMAGKSALLRQTALIVLMAQIGCFVPATQAHVGIIDKIFTRVGASDNISMGESTFMVEMNEAANIINNLSHRSLVLFDELGRGTSTYDGISIAWAIVEHIHTNPNNFRPKTLFATHYHELNEMEGLFERIHNYNVAVKETPKNVIFLRKLERGGSEHSFGIHVARMAGMPRNIVSRAKELLLQLEKNNRKSDGGDVKANRKKLADLQDPIQLSFFQLDDPVLMDIRDEIKNLDINNLTPIEALNKLSEIKKIVLGKE
ncbi:MAG: DNA mismatch repair protein MutS [Bacteroidales bacterium]|nr:DNA mismatch repair protein MutS [Bacteroidales bacterium]